MRLTHATTTRDPLDQRERWGQTGSGGVRSSFKFFGYFAESAGAPGSTQAWQEGRWGNTLANGPIRGLLFGAGIIRVPHAEIQRKSRAKPHRKAVSHPQILRRRLRKSIWRGFARWSAQVLRSGAVGVETSRQVATAVRGAGVPGAAVHGDHQRGTRLGAGSLPSRKRSEFDPEIFLVASRRLRRITGSETETPAPP